MPLMGWPVNNIPSHKRKFPSIAVDPERAFVDDADVVVSFAMFVHW